MVQELLSAAAMPMSHVGLNQRERVLMQCGPKDEAPAYHHRNTDNAGARTRLRSWWAWANCRQQRSRGPSFRRLARELRRPTPRWCGDEHRQDQRAAREQLLLTPSRAWMDGRAGRANRCNSWASQRTFVAARHYSLVAGHRNKMCEPKNGCKTHTYKDEHMNNDKTGAGNPEG